jgi:hypothetical protein
MEGVVCEVGRVAVSKNSERRIAGWVADCQSAIRQSATLRYDGGATMAEVREG